MDMEVKNDFLEHMKLFDLRNRIKWKLKRSIITISWETWTAPSWLGNHMVMGSNLIQVWNLFWASFVTA